MDKIKEFIKKKSISYNILSKILCLSYKQTYDLFNKNKYQLQPYNIIKLYEFCKEKKIKVDVFKICNFTYKDFLKIEYIYNYIKNYNLDILLDKEYQNKIEKEKQEIVDDLLNYVV